MSEIAREAEQAVLGSILINPELIKECSLDQEHFFERRHQILFRAMRHLEKSEKPVDTINLVTILGETLVNTGGFEYIVDLSNSVATTANFVYHEELVLEAFRIREASKKAKTFTESSSDEGIGELVEDLQSIMELTKKKKYRSKKDILMDVVDRIHSPKAELTGIPSGLFELDRMTGGWQKQDLIIVAARPSIGKTAFALNMGGTNCRKGGVTTIFSLEMQDVQLAFRFLSAEGNIDGQKWKNPSKLFSSEDYRKATNAISGMEKWDLEIVDDAGLTVSDIRSRMREIKRKYPDKDHLIIIDYLQLIRGKGKENRQQEVSEISRSLKALAREMDMPVIALSQLSRGVESRQDKRPMMSDIRESGSIEQDADVVAFLYRDDYYDKESENQNIIEIILAKQRNGPIGTVEAAFIKEYGKFVNLDRRHNE
ncbi:replicative DNA helicase [Halalkalibacter wakoensis JCM 9140]|uniref:Replicative DNA helicase n=1 Tax=Halalkalibacter wakoensis JCM 9140 TaxID=1236970 RepID=W4Q4Y7_9BACI|nr:replicative DNA helicase [Halalkalibacter wakoensis]GAE27005.1 replicative DNA helicase [Halalkalibacter wakoensis JCM 9140]